jgi:biofilm PGA synthesis N-glycosyltransferase PgaC
MPLVILIIFLMLVAYAILISYYHSGWNRLPQYETAETQPTTFISVVIAARNEEKNIKDLLISLQQQDYPKSLFEIIIIDDHSTDNTWDLLQEASPSINAIKMEASGGFKKLAIETGIRAATGTLIVTTDADCRFNPQWLTTLAGFYEEKKAKFIAAPVFMRHHRGLLTLFQSLDFLTLQGITGASVHRRFHCMCNGANLAYERSAFFEVNGFEGIDNIPTGDDMLLMHKIYKQYPDEVFYLKAQTAIVETESAASWPAFFQQRIRWASKADQYQDKRITWVLVLVYFLNLGILVMAVAAFFKNIWLLLFLLLFAAKILIEFPFVQSVARFFGQLRLMKYFPFLQPLHILYTIIAGLLGRFGSYRWKGRTVRR